LIRIDFHLLTCRWICGLIALVNLEAHKIVLEMEKHTPQIGARNPYNPAAVIYFLSIQMSRLLILLADDASKSSDNLTRQTDKAGKLIPDQDGE